MGIPYDEAPGAYTGTVADPAVNSLYHYDGRPIRMVIAPPGQGGEVPTADGEDEDVGRGGAESNKVEIIWNVTVPLVADSLGERQSGDKASGHPVYPHRGLVRRQVDIYRSLLSAPDPRAVKAHHPGYFHLHVDRDQPQIFLTRYSPDTSFPDE